MKRHNIAMTALISALFMTSAAQAQLAPKDVQGEQPVSAQPVAEATAEPAEENSADGASKKTAVPVPGSSAEPVVKATEANPVNSGEFNEEYLKLQRQLDLIKLQADIAEQQRRINEAKKAPAEGNSSNSTAVPGFPGGAMPGAFMPTNAPAAAKPTVAVKSSTKSASKKSASIHDLYVTRIEGFGSNLSATVYYQNHIVTVKQGAEVLPGIVVESITANGAVFRQGKQRVRVPLTTGEIAHRKSFEQPEQSVKALDPYAVPNLPFGMQ